MSVNKNKPKKKNPQKHRKQYLLLWLCTKHTVTQQQNIKTTAKPDTQQWKRQQNQTQLQSQKHNSETKSTANPNRQERNLKHTKIKYTVAKPKTQERCQIHNSQPKNNHEAKNISAKWITQQNHIKQQNQTQANPTNPSKTNSKTKYITQTTNPSAQQWSQCVFALWMRLALMWTFPDGLIKICTQKCVHTVVGWWTADKIITGKTARAVYCIQQTVRGPVWGRDQTTAGKPWASEQTVPFPNYRNSFRMPII